MTVPTHDEAHEGTLGSRLNWLRAAVLGANDGIVSTASLVLGVAPDGVSCPYLVGRTGAVVRCRATVLKTTLIAPVTVISVVPAQYRTVYRFSATVFDRRLNPALPSLLRAIRHGGVGS